MKNLLNVSGAQQLSKKEQNAINGGVPDCRAWCGPTGGNWVGPPQYCQCN